MSSRCSSLRRLEAASRERWTTFRSFLATRAEPGRHRRSRRDRRRASRRRSRAPKRRRMTEPLLELKRLAVSFATDDGTVRAVDGIDLALQRGRTLGLVGESGCGKSVTSLAIMGLLPPENSKVSGEVHFEGRDLLKLAAGRAARPARRAARHDLPGADDLAQSELHDRQPDRRGDPAPPGPRRRRGARRGRSRCCGWCASRRRRSASTTIRTSSRAACASAR